MRAKQLLMTGAAATVLCLSLAGTGMANPNEAPAISDEIARQLRLMNSQISDLELRDESLNRDGLTANYYAGFSLTAAAPHSAYAEVDSGPGYVVVQKVISEGDPVPVSGNVLGAYEEGAWEVQVNVTEVQEPGGQQLERFQKSDRVVMMAGSADLEAFIAARKEAQALAHELALQAIEEGAVEAKLRAELEAKQALANAEAEAEAREIERRLAAREEARLVAERAAADAMIMALFEDGATVPGQLAHGGERAGGTLEISRISDEVLELAASFPRGAQGTYTTQGIIKLSPEPGLLHITLPKVNAWNESSGRQCSTTAAPNVEGGFVRFVNQDGSCSFELLIEGLAVPAEEPEGATEG